MVNLDISTIELNEKDNEIYVYFEGLDDYKINKVKEIIDTPAIEYKEQILKVQH